MTDSVTVDPSHAVSDAAGSGTVPRMTTAVGRGQRRRLGDILVEAGLVTREQLAEALEYQQLWGHKLGTALVSKKFITEGELVTVLGRELGLETCEPLDIDVPQEVLALVPKKFVAEHDMLPIRLDQHGGLRRLVVATSDPFNIDALSQLRALIRMDVVPAVAPMTSLVKAIRERYGVMSAANRVAAFADSEMVVIQPGGDELVVGPNGVKHAAKSKAKHDPFADPGAPPAARQEEDTTHVPRQLKVPAHEVPTHRNAIPATPAYPAPAMAYPVVPGYPAMGYPQAYAQPAYPMQPMQPMQVAATPMMPTAPSMPAVQALPPMPAWKNPAAPNPSAAEASTLQSATASNAQTLPSAPPPAEAKANAATTLQVMEEISKYSPKELMLSIVRILLKKGILDGGELIAELKRRS